MNVPVTPSAWYNQHQALHGIGVLIPHSKAWKAPIDGTSPSSSLCRSSGQSHRTALMVANKPQSPLSSPCDHGRKFVRFTMSSAPRKSEHKPDGHEPPMVALIAAFHRVLLNSCHAGFILVSCQLGRLAPLGQYPHRCYCRGISTLPMGAFAPGVDPDPLTDLLGYAAYDEGHGWDRRPHPPSNSPCGGTPTPSPLPALERVLGPRRPP